MKVAGVFLLIVGFVALVTPFTPGAIILLLLGLEFLGMRDAVLEWFNSKTKKEK